MRRTKFITSRNRKGKHNLLWRRRLGSGVSTRAGFRVWVQGFPREQAFVRLVIGTFKGQTLVNVGSIGKECPKRVLKRHR